MQKWEYLIADCRFNDKSEKWQFFCNNQEYQSSTSLCNSLGEAGWELVSSASFEQTGLKGLPRMPSTYTYCIELFFKRLKS